MRTKILPSLADGQMAFVIDGKSSTKRLHQSLPSAVEPLPLVEPAIVLGLADPKLFREGMSDLFELADEVVDAVREMNPDALPAEYRVPEPVKNKVEGEPSGRIRSPTAVSTRRCSHRSVSVNRLPCCRSCRSRPVGCS